MQEVLPPYRGIGFQKAITPLSPATTIPVSTKRYEVTPDLETGNDLIDSEHRMLFDAINDPVMGLIVDNTRSRWGKFRPWILLGTILNAIVLAFLFFNPGLSGSQQLAYIAVTYVLWGLTYTLMDIPYWSMVPALTDDEKERDVISVIPRISPAWPGW